MTKACMCAWSVSHKLDEFRKYSDLCVGLYVCPCGCSTSTRSRTSQLAVNASATDTPTTARWIQLRGLVTHTACGVWPVREAGAHRCHIAPLSVCQRSLVGISWPCAAVFLCRIKNAVTHSEVRLLPAVDKTLFVYGDWVPDVSSYT